ncbi:AAA family ATPase [Streptomyces xiamenensis]
MIVWLNGTFGAGKTTTTRHLAGLLPGSYVFDAEQVGYLLRGVLAGRHPARNFQEWHPWRSLVVATARELLRFTGGGPLIIPQTVLTRAYWDELTDGFATEPAVPVHHFVLHTDPDTLARRIKADTPGIREWRLAHLDTYTAALPWLRTEAHVIDTTHTPPAEVARTIAGRL